MSLYVIDDHPLMREAMVMLLRRLRAGADVVELSHLGQFVAATQTHGAPEMICLDLKLPDTLGISGITEIRSLYPQTPLAVISSEPASSCEEQCIEAGADIYIEKSAGATEISAALRTLLAQDHEPEESDGASSTQLSKRQKQLILMLDQGLSNREIAEKLGISEHTVKVHLWRLFKRLGVNSRTQTLHYARTNGLLIH